MFVNSLISDNDQRSAEGNVTWGQIEQAIRELNGGSVSEVSIALRGTESHMSVTGGNVHFLVSATLDNDVFYDLLNPVGSSTEKVRLRAGGETTTVGLHEVVDIETALEVTKKFAEEGMIDQSKSWLRNPPE